MKKATHVEVLSPCSTMKAFITEEVCVHRVHVTELSAAEVSSSSAQGACGTSTTLLEGMEEQGEGCVLRAALLSGGRSGQALAMVNSCVVHCSSSGTLMSSVIYFSL